MTYLKIVDLKKGVCVFYHECEAMLLSGDKTFLWLMDRGQVYDIVNGISTFFIWPEDKINTPGYDILDVFNVDSQRTIMSTMGRLHLAFNYYSFIIDEELEKDIVKVSITVL